LASNGYVGGGAQYLGFNIDLPSITLALHGILPAFRGAIGYPF
jgi:hypothetical protein